MDKSRDINASFWGPNAKAFFVQAAIGGSVAWFAHWLLYDWIVSGVKGVVSGI